MILLNDSDYWDIYKEGMRCSVDYSWGFEPSDGLGWRWSAVIPSWQQQKAAKEFVQYWSDKGYEKGQSQPFWLSLLRDVYGVEHPEQYILFEEQVHLDASTGFIDGRIPATRVMIEQKSRGKNLNQAIRQSDGSWLTPFTQAKRYISELPVDDHPRWVVTCNFEEFYVYDMNRPHGDPEKIKLENLPKEYYRLNFLVNERDDRLQRELELSLAAGDIVGKIYDALRKEYKDPDAPSTLHSLNVLCVRLVFCLYAEDAGVFPKHAQFHDYLRGIPLSMMRRGLVELFRVLDQTQNERDPYLEPELAAFPYVDGGLFSDTDIEIPLFTEEIRDLILKDASENFDWSEISPAIFGGVFESTLNQETRRSGGMHYTSIENIHKCINPLFLDRLNEELEELLDKPISKKRRNLLNAFKLKLSELTFLDPACGSGNFLTETYISLRRMENRIIREEVDAVEGQYALGDIIDDAALGIRVGIGQFYGFEINDFAVSVARTALWIAEHQMMRETSQIIQRDLDFLPLKTDAHIIEGNALQVDWESIVPKSRLNYIMGNPPFSGARIMSVKQKEDVLAIFDGWKTAGNLDYVSCWFKKASDYMTGTGIRTALVATNSITQGDSIATLWKPLIQDGIHIDFAHRTFRWDSEASIKAHVHCVIVGFSKAPLQEHEKKRIFDGNRAVIADNINVYLTDAEDIFVESRNCPIAEVPVLCLGGQPLDDGNLILTEEEKTELLAAYPFAAKLIRPFMMGQDFIKRNPRFCLWLKDADPSILNQCPKILERIRKVKVFREQSNRLSTRRAADFPTLFGAPVECDKDYIAFPKVSSENRRYIPIDYLSSDVIPGDKLFVMRESSLFHFGILTSNVHMAWMRAVCGRLKSDYSYSNTIVYNNFPWPDPTPTQRIRIEKTAKEILDARALFPNSSLADLYNELSMPAALRKAHQANDRAVMQAYGLPIKGTTEADCVAFLMRRYREITS